MLAPSTFALLASLVMAGAGVAAFVAIAVTLRAQLPAVRKVFADARTIAQDRAFLVQVVGVSQSVPAHDISHLRRMPARVVRPVRTATVQPLRAAA